MYKVVVLKGNKVHMCFTFHVFNSSVESNIMSSVNAGYTIKISKIC